MTALMYPHGLVYQPSRPGLRWALCGREHLERPEGEGTSIGQGGSEGEQARSREGAREQARSSEGVREQARSSEGVREQARSSEGVREQARSSEAVPLSAPQVFTGSPSPPGRPCVPFSPCKPCEVGVAGDAGSHDMHALCTPCGPQIRGHPLFQHVPRVPASESKHYVI